MKLIKAANPSGKFTQVPNQVIRDQDLSLQAKGIYAWMRSHQDGWKTNIRNMAKSLGISPTTAQKYVKELLDAGYVERKQIRSPHGHFSDFEYRFTQLSDSEEGVRMWRSPNRCDLKS